MQNNNNNMQAFNAGSNPTFFGGAFGGGGGGPGLLGFGMIGAGPAQPDPLAHQFMFDQNNFNPFTAMPTLPAAPMPPGFVDMNMQPGGFPQPQQPQYGEPNTGNNSWAMNPPIQQDWNIGNNAPMPNPNGNMNNNMNFGGPGFGMPQPGWQQQPTFPQNNGFSNPWASQGYEESSINKPRGNQVVPGRY